MKNNNHSIWKCLCTSACLIRQITCSDLNFMFLQVPLKLLQMRLNLKRNQIFKQKNNTFFMINKHKLCNLWNFSSYFLIRFSNYTPLLQRIGNLGPPNSMWTNETSSDISENNWLLNNIIAEQFAVHWARRLRFHISTNASLDD